MHRMNLASIDLNLLVALEALLSEAHVGRAAQKIGLSQPATSHALGRLRNLVGDPLLVRVGPRMELTPRAAAMREPLREILQRANGLFVTEGFDPKTSSRRFALMMHDHVAHLLIPALLKRVHSEAPEVCLDIVPAQNPRSSRADLSSSVDLLISCSDDEVSGFAREPLFSDTEVVVVRTGHPARSKLRDLSILLNCRHVAVVGPGQNEDPVDRWLKQEGATRRIGLQVPGYFQALQAVAHTDLVAIVPKRLAEFFMDQLSLVLVRLPIDPGKYQEYVLYPLRGAQDRALHWLRTIVRQIGGRLDAHRRNAADAVAVASMF